ncbi:MAG TPA: phosphoribosyltransferase [Acidimicrobiales bacterium]|nr:phosphoribosyltransferase [Acidimicrobiales bacterium]
MTLTSSPVAFHDRHDAGQKLGQRLIQFGEERPIVLGLARGGIPVAAEVARALDAPLDALIVRKLGVPGHPEFAFGAIGEENARTINDDVVTSLRLSKAAIDTVERREYEELLRRVTRYRNGRDALNLEGRNVIIVDDGLATGASARVGVEVARARGARRVLVAVPVGSTQAVEELLQVADDVIALFIPPRFQAVGQWYETFDQTSDAEVVRLLNAQRPTPTSA